MATNAPLVLFRILFGLLMCAECWGALATGWVRRAFVEPRWTFPLIGFERLDVLSGPWMYGYFAVLGLCALAVAAGYRYRWSSAALALLWTGAYLAQKTNYNNHYYLAVLLAWAMAMLPAERNLSLDVRQGRVERTAHCPAWISRAFRLQIGIVFGYAALAKFYPGWLEGDFLRARFTGTADRWPFGTLTQQAAFQRFLAPTAIVFDALIVPALYWRRTRWLALAGLAGFNLFNGIVFRIGVFPLLVMALTVFFFEDRFARFSKPAAPEAPPTAPPGGYALRTVFAAALLLQLLAPLRHHLLPGDVNWNEAGHRMSWRMMLRTKSGSVVLRARDPDTNESWRVPQDEFLTRRQRNRVACQPEFLYQFARRLEQHYADLGHRRLELYATDSSVSLNATPPHPLYDPEFDLTEARWSLLGGDPWVLERPRP